MTRRRGWAGAALLAVALTGCAPIDGGQQAMQDVPAPSATPSTASEPPASSEPTETLDPNRPTDTPTGSPTGPELDEEALRDLAAKVEALPAPDRQVEGGDVSWPQCPKGMGIPEKQGLGLPMPLPSAEFVVFGLTNGPAFTPNPCLTEQVQWARERELMVAAYAVNSYPDDETLEEHGQDGPYDGSRRLGALSNVGYQQARYNIATMEDAGLTSPVVWLDVEPVPVFEWSDDPRANAAVVKGAARGYTDAGYRIGVYSTVLLWETVVGDLELGLREWRAAGQTSRAEALRRCEEEYSFQGGRPVITQWVEDNRDRNVTCPGAAAELEDWFHQF